MSDLAQQASDDLTKLTAAVAGMTGSIQVVPDPPSEGPAPKDLFGRVCHAIRIGWRPASGWVCVLILAVNGVALPMARLRGVALEPLDWHALTPFAALLVAQAGLRSWEKIKGADE